MIERNSPDFRDQCAYLAGAGGQGAKTRCTTPATYRFPLRCVDHSGHLDFTERWIVGKSVAPCGLCYLLLGRWEPWRPVHALDFVKGLEEIA